MTIDSSTMSELTISNKKALSSSNNLIAEKILILVSLLDNLGTEEKLHHLNDAVNFLLESHENITIEQWKELLTFFFPLTNPFSLTAWQQVVAFCPEIILPLGELIKKSVQLSAHLNTFFNPDQSQALSHYDRWVLITKIVPAILPILRESLATVPSQQKLMLLNSGFVTSPVIKSTQTEKLNLLFLTLQCEEQGKADQAAIIKNALDWLNQIELEAATLDQVFNFFSIRQHAHSDAPWRLVAKNYPLILPSLFQLLVKIKNGSHLLFNLMEEQGRDGLGLIVMARYAPKTLISWLHFIMNSEQEKQDIIARLADLLAQRDSNNCTGWHQSLRRAPEASQWFVATLLSNQEVADTLLTQTFYIKMNCPDGDQWSVWDMITRFVPTIWSLLFKLMLDEPKFMPPFIGSLNSEHLGDGWNGWNLLGRYAHKQILPFLQYLTTAADININSLTGMFRKNRIRNSKIGFTMWDHIKEFQKDAWSEFQPLQECLHKRVRETLIENLKADVADHKQELESGNDRHKLEPLYNFFLAPRDRPDLNADETDLVYENLKSKVIIEHNEYHVGYRIKLGGCFPLASSSMEGRTLFATQGVINKFMQKAVSSGIDSAVSHNERLDVVNYGYDKRHNSTPEKIKHLTSQIRQQIERDDLILMSPIKK